jgi:predicted acylesterase/phospholipase RssA
VKSNKVKPILDDDLTEIAKETLENQKSILEPEETVELEVFLRSYHQVEKLDVGDYTWIEKVLREEIAVWRERRGVFSNIMESLGAMEAALASSSLTEESGKRAAIEKVSDMLAWLAWEQRLQKIAKNEISCRDLILRSSTLEDVHAINLSWYLRDNKTILFLDLSNNNITDKGALSLLYHLALNSEVALFIELSGNPISAKLLHLINECFQEKRRSYRIKLIENQIELLTRRFGSDHLYLLDNLNDLAFAYLQGGTESELISAMKLTESAMKIYSKRHFDSPHLETYNLNMSILEEMLHQKQKISARTVTPAEQSKGSKELLDHQVHRKNIESMLPTLSPLDWIPPPRYKRPIRILCMDGGGMRGLCLIEMLKYLQLFLGCKNIVERFDLICGTSTGGLVALGLGVKKVSLEEIQSMYWSIGNNVFSQHLAKQMHGLMKKSSRYDTKKYESLLLESFGDIPLKQSNNPNNTNSNNNNKNTNTNSTNNNNNTPNNLKSHSRNSSSSSFFSTFAQTTQNLQSSSTNKLESSANPKVFVVCVSKNMPVVLRSYDTHYDDDELSNCLVYEAARATTAAPTFFKPSKINGTTLVDGAFGYNNPTKLAYSEAIDLWPERDLCIVSLGTGLVPDSWQEKEKRWGLFETLSSATYAVTDSEPTHYDMLTLTRSKMMINIDYFRFNPPDLGKYPLDVHGKQKLEEIESKTVEYITQQRAELQKLKDILDLEDEPTDLERKMLRSASLSTSNSARSSRNPSPTTSGRSTLRRGTVDLLKAPQASLRNLVNKLDLKFRQL